MGHGKAWRPDDDAQLERLLAHGVDYAACAHTLGRSILAVRIRAMKLRRHPRTFTQRGPVPSDSGAPSETRPPEPVQLGPIAVAQVREPARANFPEGYDPNMVDFYGRILRPSIYTCSNCGSDRL